MTEEEKIDILMELFDWPSADKMMRFQALTVLRRCRGEPTPTWDDYRLT